MTRLQDAILSATARATPSLRDLARSANISPSTLSSWRRGTRVPPADAVEALAAALEEQGRLVGFVADRLRRAAEEMYADEGRAKWLVEE